MYIKYFFTRFILPNNLDAVLRELSKLRIPSLGQEI